MLQTKFFLKFTTILLLSSLFGVQTFAECRFSNLLSKKQCEEVSKLKEMGIPVIVKNFTIDGKKKTLVVLGENHFKDPAVALLEMDFIELFPFRFAEASNGTGDEHSSFGEFLLSKTREDDFRLQEYYRSMVSYFPSSIDYLYEKGFSFTSEGRVFFNDCDLGIVQNRQFYAHRNLDFIKSELDQNLRAHFFKTLFKNIKHISYIQNEIVKDEHYSVLDRKRENPSCVLEEKITREDIEKLTVEVERGKLSHWKNSCESSYCTYDTHFSDHKGIDLHDHSSCSNNEPTELNLDTWFKDNLSYLKFLKMDAEAIGYLPFTKIKLLEYLYIDPNIEKSGSPGYRELFMADNIYKSLKFPLSDVGLLVVGMAHLGFFNHFFSKSLNTEGDGRSVWEVQGLEEYRR